VPLQMRYTFDGDVYDGTSTYQSGSYYRILNVTVCWGNVDIYGPNFKYYHPT